MEIMFIIVIAVNTLSILFLLISLWRLRTYLRKNSLEESKYTLLFGFIRLEGYVYAYTVCTIAYGAFLWFIMT